MERMDHNTFWCNHPATRLVYKTFSNGSIHYYQQCTLCHEQVTDWIGKKELGNKILSALDENQDGNGVIFPKTLEEMRAHKEHVKRVGSGKYQEYLKSKAWAKISRECLQRDKYTCRAKLKGCIKQASQAHHLTYDNVFHENLSDLISVCTPCHERITNEKIDLRVKWVTM